MNIEHVCTANRGTLIAFELFNLSKVYLMYFQSDIYCKRANYFIPGKKI